MNKNQIFKNLIAYFLQRQRIVMLAMLDLSPKVLRLYGKKIEGIELQPYIHRYLKIQSEITDPYSYHRGVWNKTWRYRLHGIGCSLTHVSTQEQIEWDAPDLEAFRFDWFWHHLEWRLLNQTHDPFVSYLLEFYDETSEQEVCDQLLQDQVIHIGIDGIAKLTDI